MAVTTEFLKNHSRTWEGNRIDNINVKKCFRQEEANNTLVSQRRKLGTGVKRRWCLRHLLAWKWILEDLLFGTLEKMLWETRRVYMCDFPIIKYFSMQSKECHHLIVQKKNVVTQILLMGTFTNNFMWPFFRKWSRWCFLYYKSVPFILKFSGDRIFRDTFNKHQKMKWLYLHGGGAGILSQVGASF